jgi:hypothetical protein
MLTLGVEVRQRVHVMLAISSVCRLDRARPRRMIVGSWPIWVAG